MKEIEFAELRINDGDGGDYLNIYSEGVTHSYLIEDVFERMNEPTDAILRARVGELERERDELQGLVFDISGWLSNWEPDFTEDDEWEDVAKRIDAALAKGAK